MMRSKMISNNSKGFTMVELIVSMAILAIIMTEIMALMFNTSKVYQRGTAEVDLQSESQQIIQQFEELVIDANLSVSYDGTTIQVKNNPGKSYDFTLSPVAGKSYNDLMLSVDGGTAQIMGEYVKSVSVDLANYDDASKIVFMIEMENDMYSYSAAKDIYLRNNIGTNDIQVSGGISGNAAYYLNVLRYHKYDLKALYGDYDYKFEADVHSEYDLSSVYELKTSETFNAASNDNSEPQYLIDAIDGVDAEGNDNVIFKIQISSEKVTFGMDGTGVIVLPPTSTSYDNFYSATGISIAPSDIKSISYEMCTKIDMASGMSGKYTIKTNLGGDKSFTEDDGGGSSYTVLNETNKSYGPISGTALSSAMSVEPGDFSYEIRSGSGALLANAMQMKMFKLEFEFYEENNDLCCRNSENFEGSNFHTSELYDFIDSYGIPYVKVIIKYEYPTRDLILKLYPYPVANYAYDGATKERFLDLSK